MPEFIAMYFVCDAVFFDFLVLPIDDSYMKLRPPARDPTRNGSLVHCRSLCNREVQRFSAALLPGPNIGLEAIVSPCPFCEFGVVQFSVTRNWGAGDFDFELASQLSHLRLFS